MIELILLAVLIIPCALLRGLVLSDLIGWFTPFNVSIIQAIGISMIVTLLTIRVTYADQHADPRPTTKRLTDGIVQSLFISLFTWGVAYLWHLFL